MAEYKKFLLLNADDFGMCHSANKAVFELFESGNLLSSTIMMPCPAAEEAVKFSVDHPQYAIGIHTTLTSEWRDYRWRPLTAGKSLIDPRDGYMWHESDEVEKHTDYKEVEAEVRAQIDKALALGMKPSHVDNHMGSLYGHYTGRFSFLKLALRICSDYGYPYRIFTNADKRVCPPGVPYPAYQVLTLIARSWIKKFGVVTPDYLLFPDWSEKGLRASYEHYRERILQIWTDLPDGVTETFVHPAVESDEIKGITSMWQCRVWEYQLLKDPVMHQTLEEKGVKLISYRDLVEMKSKAKGI